MLFYYQPQPSSVPAVTQIFAKSMPEARREENSPGFSRGYQCWKEEAVLLFPTTSARYVDETNEESDLINTQETPAILALSELLIPYR